MKLAILYEDSRILAINKPAMLLSAPDRYDPTAPTAKALLEPQHGSLWPVHRLDKDTSGVLLFAKNEEDHKSLCQAFEAHSIQKKYMAIVRGRPDWRETTCELPLLPDGDKRHRTIIDAAMGKKALTAFTLIQTWGSYSLVEARPVTGRTHQIRVHLAALGFPVACDPLYGSPEPIFLSKVKKGWKGDPYDEKPLMARTALHAQAIDFARMLDNGTMAIRALYIEAPYPKDFKALLAQFSKL